MVLEVLFEVDELRVVFWIAEGLSGVVLLVGNIEFCGRFVLVGFGILSEFPFKSEGVEGWPYQALFALYDLRIYEWRTPGPLLSCSHNSGWLGTFRSPFTIKIRNTVKTSNFM